MNAWLLDKCIAYAKAHSHHEQTAQTIWQMFEAERTLDSRGDLCDLVVAAADASFQNVIMLPMTLGSLLRKLDKALGMLRSSSH